MVLSHHDLQRHDAASTFFRPARCRVNYLKKNLAAIFEITLQNDILGHNCVVKLEKCSSEARYLVLPPSQAADREHRVKERCHRHAKAEL